MKDEGNDDGMTTYKEPNARPIRMEYASKRTVYRMEKEKSRC
jgi:hypothetical protein